MMREEMAAKCEERTVGMETRCSGTVTLTQVHLDDAEGTTPEAKRNDILAEARIGCSQKCNCQSASAQFRKVKDKDGVEIEVVEASCNQSPGALALGHMIK